MLDKFSAIELHPQPQVCILKEGEDNGLNCTSMGCGDEGKGQPCLGLQIRSPLTAQLSLQVPLAAVEAILSEEQ